MASKHGGKWMPEDVEDVYPGVVFDGNGHAKDDPIHVVIPKLIPIQLEVSLAGYKGFWKCSSLLKPQKIQ